MPLEDFMTCITNGDIPPEPPDGLLTGDDGAWSPALDAAQTYGDFLRARTACLEQGMWAIVDRRWTAELAQWLGARRVLEIMAGRGWLAKALTLHGIQVSASDDGSWAGRQASLTPLCEVQPLDALAAVYTLGEQAEVLLVSWPPAGDPALCQVAAAWGGDRPIVYLGEGRGGRNAPAAFFDALPLVEALEFSLPSWYGFHDAVWIGHYRAPPNGPGSPVATTPASR
jgi:hypothetical protein